MEINISLFSPFSAPAISDKQLRGGGLRSKGILGDVFLKSEYPQHCEEGKLNTQKTFPLELGNWRLTNHVPEHTSSRPRMPTPSSYWLAVSAN